MTMILYTKTICPKCMGVKGVIEANGYTDQVKIVNIDHDEAARQKLIDNNALELPILEKDGELIRGHGQIFAMFNE